MENRLELIKNAMEDKAFVEKIAAMDDGLDVQAAFSEKGIEMTLEEIAQIAAIAFGDKSDELEESALEAVAGGVLAEIAIVAAGVALFANTMAEINKERKAQGKKTIW